MFNFLNIPTVLDSLVGKNSGDEVLPLRTGINKDWGRRLPVESFKF